MPFSGYPYAAALQPAARWTAATGAGRYDSSLEPAARWTAAEAAESRYATALQAGPRWLTELPAAG